MDEVAGVLGLDRTVAPSSVFQTMMEESGVGVASVVEEINQEDEDSFPTTPSDSVISINDDDSKDEMIDLTNYDDLGMKHAAEENLLLAQQPRSASISSGEEEEEEDDSTEARLRADTSRVLRILNDESGPPQEWEEVYAYLEAHLLKPNRVQIVVEEFLGMAETRREEEEETPPPSLRQPSPEPSLVGKGKGKGKGKRLGIRAISPEAISPVEITPDRVEKREHSPEEEKPKKQKTEEEGVAPNELNPIVKKKRHRKPVRQSPLSDEMLYGPFDFSSHRNPTSRSNQRTQNLSSGLHDLVEGSARQPGKKSFALAPSRLANSAGREEAQAPPKPSTRNYITPGKLGAPPVLNVAGSVIREARLLVPNPDPPPANPRQRAPSVELVGEEVGAGPVVVEVDDRDEGNEEEVKELANNLAAMFPQTPPEYIRLRVQDLVGRPAAIERFTEELLTSPTPPSNWRQMYSRPFTVQEPLQPTSLVEQPAITIPEEPGTQPALPKEERTRQPDLLQDKEEKTIAGGALATDPAPSTATASPLVRSLSEPALPAAPQPEDLVGTNSAPLQQPSTSNREPVDVVQEWTEEKQDFMVAMFPTLCPDWLLGAVQSCLAQRPTPLLAEGAEVSEPPVDLGEGGKTPVDIATMDLKFQTKVEEIFLMSPEERAKLPTRMEWEAREKARAELEKWSGAMSVKDMLELYQDDPAGYFGNPDRKPESEGYKQHAQAALKDQFRYHSITEIEKSFKKSRSLFTPAFRHLKHLMETGRRTRKTQRPDFEIKYPSQPCIELLKEKKFCELEEAIAAEKTRRAAEREAAVEAARAAGLLEECQCCYSTDCLREDMVQCKGGHCYCKECVARGASVAIGDGKTIIECLGHCSEEIGWQELQKALAPNILSKLLQRRQAEEVGAAGMEDLVTCPFCPYQTIMENPDDRVLACRNPECGRESCRLCKEPNHVPLRCDEVEKKDEEEARKKIEEQLSEAMIRECWKCHAKYFKEEGCNKMTCPKPGCGAKMCYLCKQPVKDYTHFYGQGGAPTATKTCPLWTDNKRLHEQEVANAAAKAKEELQAQNPNLKLKHDPTKDIRMPAQPVNHHGQAPDLAEVIAPGVPREELVRQQRYIEEVIMGRGHGHHHHPGQHLRFHPGQPVGQPHLQHHRYHQHLPPHPVPGQMPWQDGFIARMGEILRLREQNRVNLRVVRQREAMAMRELQRANNLVPAPAHAAAAVAFGIPQAVPEPAPFLDLVEAQGRNIQVVQRGFFPAQQHLVAPRPIVAPQVQMRAAQVEEARQRQERQAALVEEDQRRDRERQRHERRGATVEEDNLQRGREAETRRRQERRQRHEMIREQLEATRRRARQTQDALLTVEQRERSARSREEALARLRRNREEVQRRQRRAEEGRLRRQRGEQAPAQQDQLQANQGPARQFNFQEILDLDALNPEYLGM